jgi:GH18 family chitinase
MRQKFEIGAYYHNLNEIDVTGIDHATFLRATPDELKAFQKKHPRIDVSMAFDKKTVQPGLKEVTLIVHKGMHLEKECQALLGCGFQVRIALPCSTELLNSFDVRALASLPVKIDLMAFDYVHPAISSRTNFHTLLFAWEGPSVVQTFRFLHDHGIDLKRVNLGLTSLGILFKNVSPGMYSTGYAQPFQGEQLKNPQMSSVEIDSYLEAHPAAKVFYTSLQGCFQSFIYNSETGDWISFDDPLTLQSKIEWARHQGLHGVFLYQTP